MKRASYNTSRFSSLFGVRKLLISCLLILLQRLNLTTVVFATCKELSISNRLRLT